MGNVVGHEVSEPIRALVVGEDWIRPQLAELGRRVCVEMAEFEGQEDRLRAKVADVIGIELAEPSSS